MNIQPGELQEAAKKARERDEASRGRFIQNPALLTKMSLEAKDLLNAPGWDFLVERLNVMKGEISRRLKATQDRAFSEAQIGDDSLRALRERALVANAMIAALDQVLTLPREIVRMAENASPGGVQKNGGNSG